MFGMQMGFGGGMPMMGMGMGMPGMIGMGGMSPMLNMQMMNEMFIMMQMMTMMQLAQRMAGQNTGAFMGGMPGGMGGMGGYQFPPMGGMQGMPWGGMPGMGMPPGGMMAPTGPVPYNEVTGNRLADMAAGWNGRAFKPGQTKRCADWVSTVIEQSGQAPPGFRHQVSAAGLANYGRPVGKDQLKPGDVVFFGNTYRPGQYTHVGIYLGDGRFAHRPTANRPVRVDRLDTGYYAQKYTGGRRLNA